MKRGLILLAIVIIGISILVFIIFNGKKPNDSNIPTILPVRPPFESYVAGAGIVEAGTGNIAIGTPVSGIVVEIYVNPGDHVKVGDPLFKLDARDLEAKLVTARARIHEAVASLQIPKHRLERAEQLRKRDTNLINDQDFEEIKDETLRAEAALELAKAQVTQLQMEIERYTVRTLVAGEIIQLKMRPGEFVEATSTSMPMLLLGSDSRLKLRVDVDEHDAWRIQPEANAVAFVKGKPEQGIPLKFEYIEPFMVPKVSLTGKSTERTDTRVLQVIYSIEPGDFPVYIGQQLDAFIQTKAKSH